MKKRKLIIKIEHEKGSTTLAELTLQKPFTTIPFITDKYIKWFYEDDTEALRVYHERN